MRLAAGLGRCSAATELVPGPAQLRVRVEARQRCRLRDLVARAQGRLGRCEPDAAQPGQWRNARVLYEQARQVIDQRCAIQPDEADVQRDLSVSFERIGNVLVAQGDGPGALAAYRKGLAIRQALAARYPANANWQRDLIVSNVKLGKVTGDKAHVRRALEIAEAMREQGILAPRDAWMIEDFRRRLGDGS